MMDHWKCIFPQVIKKQTELKGISVLAGTL
jgi:hypothetical protein